MPDFTKIFTVEKEKVKFLFSKIYDSEGIKFIVTVLIKNVITTFDIQQNNKGDWKIAHPVPAWLSPLESQLVTVIKNNIRYTY